MTPVRNAFLLKLHELAANSCRDDKQIRKTGFWFQKRNPVLHLWFWAKVILSGRCPFGDWGRDRVGYKIEWVSHLERIMIPCSHQSCYAAYVHSSNWRGQMPNWIFFHHNNKNQRQELFEWLQSAADHTDWLTDWLTSSFTLICLSRENKPIFQLVH